MRNLEHAKRYQAAHKAKGLCRICPRPVKPLYRLCEEHHKAQLKYSRKKQGSRPWVPGGRGKIPKGYDGPIPEKPKAKPRIVNPKPKRIAKPKNEPILNPQWVPPDHLRELALAAAGEIQRLRQKNLRPS